VRAVYRAHQDELDALPDEDARWHRLCELNVMAQVQAVRETEIVKQAWRKDYPVVVHGWIYDLREGLLRDLDLN
jgi:carbonic anhydrase